MKFTLFSFAGVGHLQVMNVGRDDTENCFAEELNGYCSRFSVDDVRVAEVQCKRAAHGKLGPVALGAHMAEVAAVGSMNSEMRDWRHRLSATLLFVMSLNKGMPDTQRADQGTQPDSITHAQARALGANVQDVFETSSLLHGSESDVLADADVNRHVTMDRANARCWIAATRSMACSTVSRALTSPCVPSSGARSGSSSASWIMSVSATAD